MARFSLAGGLASGLRWFGRSRRKYRTEWWIMIAGVLIIGLILTMTVFPHLFTRFDPSDQNAGGQMTAPSATHLMGTDNLSRDVWARMVYGARTILGVAIAAALVSALIGIPLGLLSGFAGGLFDRILSLVMDSVYSFPGLILAIAFAAMLGPGVVNITMAVAVVYIPTYFRLVRGQTLSIKEEVYVEAARAIGARRGTILGRYVFPNVIATVVVVLSLNIADAILTEAALSYIGLGLPAGLPDWGMDLSMGKKFLPSGVWWMITFPGLMIMLLALGFTMLGEGLAEILNPRLLER
jgi:peptide/nickel transport system permease protein